MRRRNFRKKGGLVNEASTDQESNQEKSGAVEQVDKTKKKDPKKILLSFDEDEEPVVTVIKKNQDQKYARRKDRGAAQLAPSTQLPTAGDYSAEALSELKKSTPRMPPSRKDNLTSSQDKEPPKPIIKLSGSFKPKQIAKDERFEFGVTTLVDEPVSKSGRRKEEKKGTMLPPPPRPPPSTNTSEKIAEMAEKPEESLVKGEAPSIPPPGIHDLDDHFIPPDDRTIRLAKAKRERLRQAHLAPDYLPLGGASSLLSHDFKHKDMDKNSDSEEDLEEGMRMTFIGKPKQPKSKQPAPEAEDGSMDMEEEEDDDEFVQAQIRKGIGQGNTLEEKPADRKYQQETQDDQNRYWLQGLATPSLESIMHKAAEINQVLSKDLERLVLSKKQAEQNLIRTRGFLRDALEEVGNLKSVLETSGSKYTQVQEMKVYIADLCDCLQNKAVLIEELENHMKKLIEDRSREKKEKQETRDAEDLAIAEASIAAALEALSTGCSPAAAAIAADASASKAEEKSQAGAGDEGVDEFGRSLRLMRQSEAEGRAAMRKARWKHAKEGGRNCDFDLEASSDESDGEAERFLNRRNEVVQTASTVFADADPEFGSLNGIRRHLEKWKEINPSGYRDSYMPSSVPALAAPFVRLELLRWCPTAGGEVALENYHWYEELENYGQGENTTMGGDEDDNLVPILVSKIVVPMAAWMFERCWSPLSLPQSRSVAESLRELLVYVPADNVELHNLIQLVTDRLSSTAESIRLPPWPQAAVNVSAAAEAVITIRFRRALRLIRGICCFGDILPKDLIRKLTLKVIIGKGLLGYLHGGVGDATGTVMRLSTIIQQMPSEWFSGSVPTDAPYLLDLLSSVAKALEGQRVEAMTQGSTETRKSAKKVADMLVSVGDPLGAARLRQTFRLL